MAKIGIIGAGAAGLFAAGTALAAGHSVTVIEHMDAAGKK
ncbi:MAG: NAD(P)/FAD-dependent oxidoreductase, partial [Ruthenibacterium sp.]